MLIKILRILNTPQIGVLKFWQLWDHFNDLDKIIEWIKENGHVIPSEDWVEKHIAVHTKNKVCILHFLDPAFPSLLKHISNTSVRVPLFCITKAT